MCNKLRFTTVNALSFVILTDEKGVSLEQFLRKKLNHMVFLPWFEAIEPFNVRRPCLFASSQHLIGGCSTIRHIYKPSHLVAETISELRKIIFNK